MVSKYKILTIVLGICLALISSTTSASAAIIDVFYTWYDTGGTKAFGDEVWTIGDVSGTKLFKIEERYDTVLGQFQYLLSNLREDHGTYGITKWELYNPGGIVATSVTDGPAGTDWSVVISADKWTWSTTDFTEGADGAGDVDNFRVVTTAPRGLVTGKVYFYNSDGAPPASNPTASGIVSGPVPEPSSVLLLGLGILGLFGLKRKPT